MLYKKYKLQNPNPITLAQEVTYAGLMLFFIRYPKLKKQNVFRQMMKMAVVIRAVVKVTVKLQVKIVMTLQLFIRTGVTSEITRNMPSMFEIRCRLE